MLLLPISHPTRSPNSKPTSPRKAPVPQTGGNNQGASGSEAVSGVKSKEANLAGYLMARAAMNRKVEGTTLNHLRAGQETVQEVRELMPLGRANVISDIEKAEGEHISLRKDASEKLARTLIFDHMRTGGELTKVEIYGAIAASSQYAKTGTCGCFASNTTALHAAKLPDRQDSRAAVSHVAHSTIDHGWSELLTKGTHADGSPILHGKDVIMDGWCKEGLAVLREDSHFARLDNDGKGDHLKHDPPLRHGTGQEALKTVEKYKARIENTPRFQKVFKKEFKYLMAMEEEWPQESLWNDTTVFHADFRRQAGQALHKDAPNPSPIPFADPASVQAKQASMAEIQAVGVARSMGSDIQGALTKAPGIIATAQDMFPVP